MSTLQISQSTFRWAGGHCKPAWQLTRTASQKFKKGCGSRPVCILRLKPSAVLLLALLVRVPTRPVAEEEDPQGWEGGFSKLFFFPSCLFFCFSLFFETPRLRFKNVIEMHHWCSIVFLLGALLVSKIVIEVIIPSEDSENSLCSCHVVLWIL